MAAPTSSSKISQASTVMASSSSQAVELFVIVRPPPSKTVNPLNVQIQVITPKDIRAPASARVSAEFERSNSASGSFDAVAQAGVAGSGTGLKRTPSVQSGRSGRSGSSSGGSAIGSSTRRVTPLYNFEAHNIQASLVTDAGTDAKVAKFLKSGGVELIGLAILEPTALEVSPSISPALRNSSSFDRRAPSPARKPTIPVITTPESSNFLGKLKRFSFNRASPSLSPVAPTFAKSESSNTLTAPTGTPIVPLFPAGEPVKSSRCASRGYTWTVRKWLRPDLEPRSRSPPTPQDIRFEWRRSPRPRISRVERVNSVISTDSSAGGGGGLAPPTMLSAIGRRASVEGESDSEDPNNLARRKEQRPSSMVTLETDRSRSPARWSGAMGGGAGSSTSLSSGAGSNTDDPDGDPDAEDGDEETRERGYDSDPEDSERPWTCEVVLGGGTKRVMLGSLTPAPHHPKLVASLAIPYSLHSVPLGFEAGKGPTSEGLSVEEMKDIVSVTCLWLVIHEQVGGVGKRKKSSGGAR